MMGNLVEDFSSYRSPISPMEMDPSLEMMMNSFPEMNATVVENPSLDLMCFSGDGFLSQPPELPVPYVDMSPEFLPLKFPPPVQDLQRTVSDIRECGRTRKRKKALVVVAPDSTPKNSSMPLQRNGSGVEVTARKKSNPGRGKERWSGMEEKPEDVVHVRAKRGQATDRHSLAERVRREKINEKIRCLQGLVPGCYKAMGMAVMLDEIINYVRSLQNQVEFLSMKLSAASAIYDFSLDPPDDAAVAVPPSLPGVMLLFLLGIMW